MCTLSLNNNNYNVLWAPLLSHFFVESSLCVDRCQHLSDHYVLALQSALMMVLKKQMQHPIPKHIIFTQHIIYIYVYSCHHTNMSQNIGYPLGGGIRYPLGGGGIRLVHRINLPSGMGKGHSKNVVKTCTLWPFP
jgi:hypothetical protein